MPTILFCYGKLFFYYFLATLKALIEKKSLLFPGNLTSRIIIVEPLSRRMRREPKPLDT